MTTDPIRQFEQWLAEASRAGALQPDAMTLATAGEDGEPSARMVLFKGIDGADFLFYSNYQSRKGRDLAANPRAALVFYWVEIRRSVRVFGRVSRLSRAASTAYFRSRPRGAQLSAAASRQSRVIKDRSELEAAVAELDRRYPGEVPLPADWGGYRVRPAWIEFWENRPDRLHERIRFHRGRKGVWRPERLSP